ncbi:phage virion morphogenesis protein [Hydrocarboniphaga effusa]|uniref:phage virion morphogenesis protein n=1 Tax=Hydrocarboniphaga effusa TaxID=243629 RepID=UPI003BAB917F
MDIRWDLTDVEIQQVLLRVSAATGGRMLEPMTEAGRMLTTSTQMRFRTQRGPDGHPWAPSQRVIKSGGQTLSLTARLRNSIAYSAKDTSVTVGTNVVYAAPIQFGFYGEQQVRAHIRRIKMVFGRELKKAVKVAVGPFSRMGRLPRREFLGFSVEDKEEIVVIFNEYFERVMRRF